MNTNKAVPPQGKVPYYRSDGTGRDTYIRDHNGGLLSHDRIHRLKQLKPIHEKKFTFSKQKNANKSKSQRYRISNNFTHYNSDGTGRDYYIKNTQGGNSHIFNWRDQTNYKFYNSLRYNNTHLQNSITINPQMILNIKKTIKSKKLNKTQFVYQQNLNKRLSQIKKIYKPPKINRYFTQQFDPTRIQEFSQLSIPQFKRSIKK